MLEIQDEKWKQRAQFKSSLDFVRMLDEYVYHLGDRVFTAKDYSCDGHTVQAEWIKERFDFYNKLPVRKRLASVAGDISSKLSSQMLMWVEPPKTSVILKELNKMLTIKKPLALYKDFYRYINAPQMLVLNPCHLHTLDDLKALYEDAEYVTLNRSYRSTCEIMSYANAICQQPCLEMIERHGPVPQTVCCESDSAELEFLAQKICEFEAGSNASLGIVVKTNADAEKLFDVLSQSHNVNLLTAESTRFSSGVSVTSIQMAKGLEFDEVLVPGASKAKYDADFDRHLLYIACTRAMHKLTVSYAGEPSRFLK